MVEKPMTARLSDVTSSVCACAFLILATLLLASRCEAADRYALVIGNSRYSNVPDLPNAAKDSAAIAAKLEALGFHVTKGIDLPYLRLHRLIAKFSSEIEAAGAKDVVFFYAGHGFQIHGHNHLVPVDAKFVSTDDVSDQTLELSWIMGLIHGSGDQTTIVLLDACRNNPLPSAVRGDADEGLAPPQIPGEGILAVFATQPGMKTKDGSGANSPFTTALLKRMSEKDVDIALFVKRVIRDVKNATGGLQVPHAQGSLLADFAFNDQRQPPVQAPAAPMPSVKTPSSVPIFFDIR